MKGRAAPLLALALCVAGCAPGTGQRGPRPAPEQSSDPRFLWFEYRGADSVFQVHRPGEGEYANPILAGFYPDPSVTRVGEDYYLVNSTFSYYPGVPIFHSRDLVSWTQLGHVLNRPSQLDLDGAGISRGIFAPTINHHEGTFYLLTTLVDRGGNFLVTARDPAGPWSDPVWLGFDGIDPSIFFDDDGRAWVVNNGPPAGPPLYDGHRALWLQELDLATHKLVGPRRVIVDGGTDLSKRPIWIEGPHIFKAGGNYYLSAAEGGTGTGHSQVVFRAAGVWGPWEPYAGNPILTQRHLPPARPFPVTSTGHADLVETQNGEWWAVFLGVRPYEGDHFNTGRETFLLPVRWRDGWPVILEGDAALPWVAPRPNLPPGPPAPLPLSGNFTARDEFAGPELQPAWQSVRTPRARWHQLAGGALTLRARPAPLGDNSAQPSFVARRQQHARARASTALSYRPLRDGDRAGLAAFYDDTHYLLLAVALRDARPVIELERRAGRGAPELIASAPLALPAGAVIYLRIDVRDGACGFHYAEREDDWRDLARDVDCRILGTAAAGGFVGAMFGLYAYTPPPGE